MNQAPEKTTTTHPRRETLTTFVADKDRESAMQVWLAIAETSIHALEKGAWQGRELAEKALAHWRAVERGASTVSEEYQQLAAEARRWPARLKRLSKTAWVLTRIVTSYRLWGTRSAFIPQRKHPQAMQELHRRNAKRFTKLSLEQGGAFLKIGQLLSCRQDLLPEAWIDELSVLQDHTTMLPWALMQDALETAWGGELSDHLQNWQETPVASASIGQVHRATLLNGQEVALKIQRPGIAEVIEQDMAVLKVFLNGLVSDMPGIDTATVITELQRILKEELDFQREGNVMAQMAQDLSGFADIHVPFVVNALTTKGVLVTEWIEGEKITEVFASLGKSERDQLLRSVLDCWLHQLFYSGLMHADPHPGNILIDQQGRVVLLDFGAVQHFTEAQRLGYFRVMQACVVAEYDTAAETLFNLGFTTQSGQPETLKVFSASLMEQVRDAILSTEEGGKWPTAADSAAQMNALLEQLDADPLTRVPGEFVMLAKVFGTLSGYFLHYQPQLNVAYLMMEYLTRPLHAPHHDAPRLTSV